MLYELLPVLSASCHWTPALESAPHHEAHANADGFREAPQVELQ